MTLTFPGQRRLLVFFLVLLIAACPANILAQCHNWTASATLVTSSSCAGNGSFVVTLSGPDVANLTNIQYGIPISANGFSVPLNNSPSFTGIPTGTFQVSVLGECGGTIVGKNLSIYIPGNYIAPTSVITLGRGTPNCGAYGTASVNILNGRAPYTIRITGAPVTYSGPITFVTNSTGVTLTGLPVGSYTTQVTDACGSGTIPSTVTIPSIDLNQIAFTLQDPVNITCNRLSVTMPAISNGNPWYGYNYDTLFKASAQLSNGISAASPFLNINQSSVMLDLAAGKTLKDCYGKNVIYTIKPPCGANITRQLAIPYPFVNASVDQNCNTDFKTTLDFRGMLCYPITYKLRNTATNVDYGPYTTTTNYPVSPSLPLGNYSISYTTADGYTGTGAVATIPVTGNPYSVQIFDGSVGLHYYIEGFRFTTSNGGLVNKTIELFSGPAGYSFVMPWTGNYDAYALENQTPGPGRRRFPAGNYVWKITDDCGSYLLPVTVGPSSIYHYDVSIRDTMQWCTGRLIWIVGSATSNGQSKPFKYSVFRDGSPVTDPVTGVWPTYNSNDPFLMTLPGEYTFVTFSDHFIRSIWPYPLEYMRSVTYKYDGYPLRVDVNNSQGFLCLGGAAGSAKIFVKGTGGMMFGNPAPPYYKYYLANQGMALSGNYLATNTTGIFTNFGGNANAIYDVKIEDACGAFSIQQIKILDLRTVRLISSTKYVACEHDSVRLSTIFLPNATYLWTGPNGFTSTQRSPLIGNINSSNIGVYRVIITTPECSASYKDSTLVTMNGAPPKPLASLACLPYPPSLTITNPIGGVRYRWQITEDMGGYQYTYMDFSDTGYTKYIYFSGYVRPLAIDSITGCRSLGDTTYFGSVPDSAFTARIYSPHLDLCTGDTTILVARGGDNLSVYQWFMNGSAIPGATDISYVTAIPGIYKVYIRTGPCDMDTSDNVTVRVVPIPSASILPSATQMCPGDTIRLQANTGSGYTYNWLKDGSSIPGAFSSVLAITDGGTYAVIVSNGGCARTSAPVTITLHPAPAINLQPAATQGICSGGHVSFSTPYNATYTYQWERNGTIIPGANTNTYQANVAGIYQVFVGNAVCPRVPSSRVTVQVIQPGIHIGNDTVICTGGPFSIPLAVDSTFGQVIWSTGSTAHTIQVTAPGTYWVRAMNVCGLQYDTIRVSTGPDATITPASEQYICIGDSVVFRVPSDPSWTYVWQKDGAVIAGAQTNTYTARSSGIYEVAVSSATCPAVASVAVKVRVAVSAIDLGPDTVICNYLPFSIPLSVDSSFSQVTWSNGQTGSAINATARGRYWVRASNACGTYTDTIWIRNLEDYFVNLPDDTIACNEMDEVTLVISPLLKNIQWSTGATFPIISVNQPGRYWVSAESPCGMIADTVNVRFCPPDIQSVDFSSSFICEGDCIRLSAQINNYPSAYHWYFPGGDPDSSDMRAPYAVCYKVRGTYPVRLIVENAGGADTFTTSVIVHPRPVPRFKDSSVTVSYHQNMLLPACATGAQTVSWYKNGILVCANCPSLTIEAEHYLSEYVCVVSNGQCADSCTYRMKVVDIPHDVWLPDAFTPNGDGRNDVFRIVTDNPNVHAVNLYVYNRWGQQIYINHSDKDGWDGTVNGKPADAGTYFWMLRYKILGSEEVFSKKGDIQLIR